MPAGPGVPGAEQAAGRRCPRCRTPRQAACSRTFVGDRPERLFHVGRLDYDTEGLLLLTNDGELAHRLAHPRYGMLKIYLADVPARCRATSGGGSSSGIMLDDGPATVDRFRVVEQAGGRALVEVTLHEGRKHIVRRLLAEAGHPVRRLVRTSIGPVGSARSGRAPSARSPQLRSASCTSRVGL